MSASASWTCSHCGKQRGQRQLCPRCKQTSYCGAACQNAALEAHKKTCVTVRNVVLKVDAARLASDWRGVLKWEGRMEQLIEGEDDSDCDSILAAFAHAHRLGFLSTRSTDHALSIVSLQERRVELLGEMQRFREQGETLCDVGDHLCFLGKRKDAGVSFQRARNIGEAHGLSTLECKSCLGLGKLAMAEGRDDEGVELLRNALVAAMSEEDDDIEDEEGDSTLELIVLLVRALLDVLRENEADARVLTVAFQQVLADASERLNILDPELGNKELIESVAAERAKLRRG